MISEPVPSLLEDLEALAVGVWGKRLLWGATARKAAEDRRLVDIEIERLVEMAEAQEIELLRLRDAELDTLMAQVPADAELDTTLMAQVPARSEDD
ncbi:MAG: hypothetical protein ACXWZF_12310 [Actinomycetota bacterium]